MTRRILGLAAAILVAAPASPALATGTVSVTLAGAGEVTGSGGIACSRTVAGATSGTCSASIPPECEIDPKPYCFPGEAVLTASDTAGTGFTFDHWAGDCAGADRSCDLTVDGDVAADAVFRDAQPPAVALTQPGAGPRAGSVALAATASDNAAVAKVEFSVRGVVRVVTSSAPYGASLDTRTLADGAATITATAYDTSGLATVSAPVTIAIDNTAPALTVSGPSGQTFAGGATETWALNATDATSGVSSVLCSVVPAGRPAAFGACSGGASGDSVSGLPEGSYTFTARATDAAGNTRDVSRAFAVDTTPPETTIASGLADGATTTATSLTWAFAASEPGSTFRCRVHPAALTPGAFAPCSGADSHTAAGFAPGTYTFEVVATDPVGNTDPTPAARTFTVVAPPVAGPPSPVSAPALTTLAPAPLPPPAIALAYAYRSRGGRTRLTRLVVQHVPAGSTVTARWPHGSWRKAHAHGSVALTALTGRWLNAATRITVTVNTLSAGTTKKVLVIRRRGGPRVI